MESTAGVSNQDGMYGRIGSSPSRRFGIQIPEPSFIRAPLTALLEHTGIFGGGNTRSFAGDRIAARLSTRRSLQDVREGENYAGEEDDDDAVATADEEEEEEVSIRIIGATEHQSEHGNVVDGASVVQRNGNGNAGPSSASDGGEGSVESGNGGASNGRESSYQRYDIQNFARWFEQILPFTLLLLLVFIRQHYQGFSVAIWIAAVMFKSNDIVRKQTALKGERKIPVLVGISSVFILHVICFYWWYRKEDLLYPLILIPPKAMMLVQVVFIPVTSLMLLVALQSVYSWSLKPMASKKFLLADIMVRQAAMAVKCMLLVCYKDIRGRDYLKQGQMLTLVEYLLLLYRALLPTPVWYRFFLNKEYGSFFSSLTTGLYLTFKLTSVVEKVQCFFVALRALSRKEVHYGSYATSEQVNAAGDLCAICQEKMHAPILLSCKHIFCEDCVSEWFERERTCPLCRALVKPAGFFGVGVCGSNVAGVDSWEDGIAGGLKDAGIFKVNSFGGDDGTWMSSNILEINVLIWVPRCWKNIWKILDCPRI
ncbi:RING finger and transmembrane domain-containing protein 2 [Morus notabilis]|uniref:RING finger and transmembrane domain-containing protein 2 n=1 Tax=Morus notabilis TaxID=981085 RepID=W9RKW8_9ROSA|nr:RING finger and transmembrane domain-containing protein 2 [Morus notabilis]